MDDSLIVGSTTGDSAGVSELSVATSSETAWTKWLKVFSRYPLMVTDDVGDEVIKSLNRYRRLADLELDDAFVLSEFLDIRRAKDDPSMGIDFEKLTAALNDRAKLLLAAESRGEENIEIPKLVFPRVGSTPAGTPAMTTNGESAKPLDSKLDADKLEVSSPAETPKGAPNVEEKLLRPPTLENPDSQD